MNITLNVNVNAPELVNAIQAMATVLSLSIAKQPTGSSHEQLSIFTDVGVGAVSSPAPNPTATPTQIIPQAPTVAPIPTLAPTPTAVPTTAQTYEMEHLAVAATQLVDAGRRNDLVALLASFGVPALTALPKEQYGTFATKLRELGAKI